MLFLSDKQEDKWKNNDKIDFYLAQIAAEIKTFRSGFGKYPKAYSPNDCLIPFKTQTEVKQTTTVTVTTTEKPKEHEIGPELIKDPKWAVVNERAKAQWGAWLGRPKDKVDKK